MDWREHVTLEIALHPELSESQKQVIALDYAMRGGKAKIKVRRALLYYATMPRNFLGSTQIPAPGNRKINR